MANARLALGLLCFFACMCHIGTERSFHAVAGYTTPSLLTKGNIRRAVKTPWKYSSQRQVSALAILSILLAGDVHCNPGPRQMNYYPCGLCDRDVQCADCIACDGCSIWYHRSCVELSSSDFDALQRPSVQWICPKCDSLNCDSFTFRSFSFSENYYSPLQGLDGSLPSITQSQRFSPLKTSSPCSDHHHSTSQSPDHYHRQHTPNATQPPTQRSHHGSYSGPHPAEHHHSTPNPNNSSSMFNVPKKKNLRIMVVNCRSLEKKRAEFATIVNYVKPDIICGTESWLKTDMQHKEVFPDGYTYYRKDRCSLAGGVFILVHNSLVSSVQTEWDTNCEILWCKIHLQQRRDLIVGCFYMPHRNQPDLNALETSLQKITASRQRQIILAGDFNCPDVNWNSGAVPPGAPERTVQESLVEITTAAYLTQIHEEPTREDNILDLIFTSNPSLNKSSKSIPGISDHSIIVADFDIHPHRTKEKPRKQYLYSKAKWEDLNSEVQQLSGVISTMREEGSSVDDMWTCFKSSLMAAVERYIPSSLRRSNYGLPWVNRKIRKLLQHKKRLYNQAKKKRYLDQLQVLPEGMPTKDEAS